MTDMTDTITINVNLEFDQLESHVKVRVTFVGRMDGRC